MSERKEAVRLKVRGKLGVMGEPQRREGSEKARKLLEGQGVWKKAKRILFYAPLAGELDVWPLFEDAIRSGKEVYLPRFVGRGTEKPLKRFPEDSGTSNTPLKQGVNETGERSGLDTPLKLCESGHYVVCAVRGPEELIEGIYGIREPLETCPELSLNRLDFVLVPGIAFDLQGRRLGRGKGYYDRLLADARGIICGVAFDEQIVEELPVEPHDIHVNCILTPTRWIELRAARGF